MRTLLTKVGWVGVATTVCLLGHHFGTRGHIRRKLGQEPVGQATCFNCHFVSVKKLAWSKPRLHHDAPAGLAVSPDGSRLFIALDDRDQIAEVDAGSLQVVRRAKVPGGPFGLALGPAGQKLYVTCRREDKLRALDAETLKETDAIPVGRDPVAVTFCISRKGERLAVANSMSDDVSVLATSPLTELSRLSTGREPFAAAASPEGVRVFIANRLVNLASVQSVPASELTIIDPAEARVVQRQDLISAHLSEGVTVVPGRSWALTPLVKIRNLVPITQVANGWVMSSGLALSDLTTGELIQLPLDEANDYFADPSAVVVDPKGEQAFVASGGSDIVSVLDLNRVAEWLHSATPKQKEGAIYDLSLSAEYVVGRIRTGRNPQQMAISPDGTRLYVAERLDDSVLVVETKSRRPIGRVVLGDGGLQDPIRRGERVFTSSAFTFQHQFSCRSCHPDGHVDGLSYDFDGDGIGDNLLDNRSLRGVAGTGPFKWNGKNPSLEIQCGPRFAKVLMRTEPFPPKQLRDLTTYIRALPPPRAALGTGAKLSPSQERGRSIFFATHTPDGKQIPVSNRCVTCHAPPLYTVRLGFNVGTKGPYDTTEAFDTPQLLGVVDTAPYLHDGRAQTLEEIWTVYSTNDTHGVTSYMNKIQLNDLVEFLKTL